MASPVVKVRMTPSEIARLDALAAERGTTRSGVLRSVLDAPALNAGRNPTKTTGETGPKSTTPTRARVLDLLAAQAEAGSVPAMIALERALRLGGPSPAPRSNEITPDELRAALRVLK